MDEQLKQQTKKGVMWSAIQRFSTQGLQFLITLVMANFLTPSDYGIVGMLGVFIALSSVFVDSGFTSALTRKQNPTQEDTSTVFFFNIVIACIAYIILFFAAPWIADFYDMPAITSVLRVLSLVIIINSFSAVQATLMTKRLDFKTQARITVIAISTSGAVGITLAFLGFTYWALVIQGIVSSLLSTFLYWFHSKWRPLLLFSKKSFCEMFSFGSKLLASSIIDTIYGNIYTVVIGKVFSAGTLGNYSRAESYANFPSISITGIMQRVTYPVLCKMQDDDQQLANAYRKFLKLSAFVVFPMMTGLSALAYPFVVATIGRQWEFCSTLLQIICFALMWYPIHAINLNLLQVEGRTDLSLRIEIIKKIIGVVILCIFIPLGIVALCYSRILSSILCLIVNTYYTGKLIHVGFIRQMLDLTPTLLISLATWGVVLFSTHFISNIYLQLAIGIAIGAITYTAISYLFNRELFHSVLTLIRR